MPGASSPCFTSWFTCSFERLNRLVYVQGDNIVETGQYGHHLTLMLTGKAKILNGEEIIHDDIDAGDREPVFGLQSCLADEQWLTVRQRTATWRVEGKSYTDTAWISRQDISECFFLWPEGILIATEIMASHYEMDAEEAAAAGDNVVQHTRAIDKSVAAAATVKGPLQGERRNSLLPGQQQESESSRGSRSSTSDGVALEMRLANVERLLLQMDRKLDRLAVPPSSPLTGPETE